MDFLNYIKGNRRGKDANHIEKDAMRNPFLRDAIDGFDSIKGNHIDQLNKIQKLIDKKSAKKHQLSKWNVLLAACLTGLIALGGYMSVFNNKKDLTAKENNCTIELYVPNTYGEKELTASCNNSNNIVNLDEFLASRRVIELKIYLPETYLKNKKNLRERGNMLNVNQK